MSQDPLFSPSDFVAVLNQSLEMTYPSILIRGELAEFRVRKNRWVYFKLVDEEASVSFFGTVHHLNHEIEEGMLLQVRGFPRLHPLYGFSVQVQFIQPAGEGSIKKSADILMQKLKQEGLFAPERKKAITAVPRRIAIVTSIESAAYQDVVKVLRQRWSGLQIEVIDVRVQGESAQADILDALYTFAHQPQPPDALLMTRGGGSAEDLAVFSTEAVTRAVAECSIPTMVAIGHETDVSLAELAADMRASTPSNAAELLVPDKKDVRAYVAQSRKMVTAYAVRTIRDAREQLQGERRELTQRFIEHLRQQRHLLEQTRRLVTALSPYEVLKRGYSIVRDEAGSVIARGSSLRVGEIITISFSDAEVQSLVQSVQSKDTTHGETHHGKKT